jgi:hypothetical protein
VGISLTARCEKRPGSYRLCFTSLNASRAFFESLRAFSASLSVSVSLISTSSSLSGEPSAYSTRKNTSPQKMYRSIAFMFGVIRSISALSFAMDASNSPSTSPEESYSFFGKNEGRMRDSVVMNASYPSLVPTENVKVYFDAIIWHSPGAPCRMSPFIVFINVHCHLIT